VLRGLEGVHVLAKLNLPFLAFHMLDISLNNTSKGFIGILGFPKSILQDILVGQQNAWMGRLEILVRLRPD
jgi:hypothetical protein